MMARGEVRPACPVRRVGGGGRRREGERGHVVTADGRRD